MYPIFSEEFTYRLPVPYHTQISLPLSAGTQIHISGISHGTRFEINLKNSFNDYVLHINPRFDENSFVLNTAQHASWGHEERHSLPVYPGIQFMMVILVTDNSFKIAVNNSHFCEFLQRLSIVLAQFIEIKGDIALESVKIYPGIEPTGNYAPFPPSSTMDSSFNFGFPSAPTPPTQPIGGPGLPSIHSCRINIGSSIFVHGFIHLGANRFELNFLQGYSNTDDIAFHFNPRFDSQTIVKNYRQRGQWGPEENQPFPTAIPLIPGSPVSLQIICNVDKYVVFMNNQFVTEYYHKIPPYYVMAIQYKGDLTVTNIGQMNT